MAANAMPTVPMDDIIRPSSPKSDDSSTAPTIFDMTPHQLKDYFTKIIAKEWKESATPLYPSRNRVVAGLMLSDKEMAICHTKFRCEDVPKKVVAEVQQLANSADEGVGCFGQLVALLKEEVRLVTFEDDVNSPKIDKYKGVGGAVAMLTELAIHRVQMDVDYGLDTDSSNRVMFKVAIIDGRGFAFTYKFSVPTDAKFEGFTKDLKQRFPRLCDPRDEDLLNRWDRHIHDLRLTGMGDYPKLPFVEKLIEDHKNMEYDALGEWIYIHENGSLGDNIRGEEDFQALMKWAQVSAGGQPKGCLMRVTEAKTREIFTALKTIEAEQLRRMRQNRRLDSEANDSNKPDPPDTKDALEDPLIEESISPGGSDSLENYDMASTPAELDRAIPAAYEDTSGTSGGSTPTIQPSSEVATTSRGSERGFVRNRPIKDVGKSETGTQPNTTVGRLGGFVKRR